MRLTPRSCTRYIESATVVSSYENKTATHLDRSKPWSDYRRSTKSSPRKACLSVCTRRRDHDHTETMAASGSRWAMILHKYPLTVGTRSFFSLPSLYFLLSIEIRWMEIERELGCGVERLNRKIGLQRLPRYQILKREKILFATTKSFVMVIVNWRNFYFFVRFSFLLKRHILLRFENLFRRKEIIKLMGGFFDLFVWLWLIIRANIYVTSRAMQSLVII